MKNELTLKHGVILAAAVLLIVGIAFAGAAAAEATHITWDKTNVSTAAANGGYYIVDVPSKEIMSVVGGVIKKNLTLDFNYQTVSIANSSYAEYVGALFGSGRVSEGKVVTIKNLLVDGGYPIVGNMAGTLLGFMDNQSGTGVGCWVLENISVKNVNVTGSWYCGGLVGAINTQGLRIVNCSLDNSLVSTNSNGGGFIGCAIGPTVIERSFVNNTSLLGSGEFGLLVDSPSNNLIVKDCSVLNTIIGSKTGSSGIKYAGLIPTVSIKSVKSYSSGSTSIIEFIGSALGAGVRIEDCDVNNCVISAYKGYAGGIFGTTVGTSLSSIITAVNNTVSSSTIVNEGWTGNVGGFAGGLNQTAVNSISNNTVTNCCVVTTSGDAAGFCPSVV